MADAKLRPGWQWVKFGDVVNLNKETTKDPLADGLDRYVGLEHLEPGDLRIRSFGNIADGTTFTNRFRPGQVLFGKRRAYQRKVAVAEFEGVCSGDIYVLETKDPKVLLPDLLPFICQTDGFFEHAVGTSAGSLSPRTNWYSLSVYEFALPPLKEQARIIRLFQSSADHVESFLELVTGARTMLDAVREELLTKCGHTVHFTGIVSAIEAGKSLIGINTPPGEGEYGVLKVSAVGRDGFRPNEAKTLVAQDAFMPQHTVRKGDLLITRANTSDLVGMTCLVQESHLNLMLCDKTLRLIPVDGVPAELILQALWTIPIRTQLRSIATGTGAAMKNISQKQLRELVLPWPRSDQDIARTLAIIADCERSLSNALSRLRIAQELHLSIVRTSEGRRM